MRRLEELGAAEVLGLALRVERNNAERFATVRDFFHHQDQAVFDLFEELRSEEVEHIAILEGVVKELYPDGVPDVQETDVEEVVEAIDVDDGEHALFDNITRESAIHMALEAEHQAEALYIRAAAHATDEKLKKVFERLAELEGDHTDRLNKMLES
jgi:rubrerythrin